MTYSRAGTPVPADTILGHRPAIDPVPPLPGTSSGARPPLLPAAPDSPIPPGPPALSPTLRSVRNARIVETRRRREMIAAFAPTIDTDWAHALSVTDDLWGIDEQWKQLADQSAAVAPPTAVPAPAQVPEHVPDSTEERQPATPSAPESASDDQTPAGAPQDTDNSTVASPSADSVGEWSPLIRVEQDAVEGIIRDRPLALGLFDAHTNCAGLQPKQGSNGMELSAKAH